MENGREVEIGADVDVKAIMAEVKAEVERKKREGLYPPEVLEELDALGAGREMDQLTRAILGLRHVVSFHTAVSTASRIPVAAPLAASFKRAVRSAVQWYVSAIVQQIEQFGANVIHVLNLVAERLRALEERVDLQKAEHEHSLQETVRSLETQIDEARSANQTAIEVLRAETGGADFRAAKRLDELELVRARERIPLIERAVRELRQKLESTGSAPARAQSAPKAERSWAVDRALDYLDFENRFLGGEEERRDRQRTYMEFFRNVPGPVADLGCGRGEFLEVLTEAGLRCYGVDRHPDMIAHSKEKGLEIVEADLLEHLASVGSGTLGGVFSSQTIEHLEVADVPRFFELASDALVEGGRLVIETLNPQSLFIFAWAFYMDLGHLRPLHPLTLQFLAEKAGFRDIRIEYYFLPPEEFRLKQVAATGDTVLDTVVEAANENFNRIDALLFGPQDYAIIATR